MHWRKILVLGGLHYVFLLVTCVTRLESLHFLAVVLRNTSHVLGKMRTYFRLFLCHNRSKAILALLGLSKTALELQKCWWPFTMLRTQPRVYLALYIDNCFTYKFHPHGWDFA